VRLRNIEANNRVLAELGLLGTAAATATAPLVTAAAAPRRPAVAKRARAVVVDEALPRRSSPRLQREPGAPRARPLKDGSDDDDNDDDGSSSSGAGVVKDTGATLGQGICGVAHLRCC
jgi:hypothetical protein